MATTQSVLEHHLQCFGTGALEQIMTDYVAESALLTPQGALQRPQMIQTFFEAAPF